MRKLALVPLLALAACSSESSDQAKTGEAAGAAANLTPGLWEMTSEVSGIEMAYKDVKAPDMKAMKTSFRTCITEEQANRPPVEAFAGNSDAKSSCKYDNFYMSRGRINASMTCDPGNRAMSIDGKYSGDSMDLTMELSTYAGTAGDMKMNARLTGHRIGPCPPEGEAAGEEKSG